MVQLRCAASLHEIDENSAAIAALQRRALQGIHRVEKGQNKTTSASEPKNSELFATY